MAEDDAQDRPVQDALGDGNPPNDKSQEGGDKPTSVKQSRKRTKTGCLTCRKRRIKCGEERPTCANCRKSKRNCEGYIQRVVFKEPVNTIRPPVPIASNFSSRAGNQPLNIAPKPSAAPSQTLRSPPDTAYPRAATFIPSTYHVPSGSHVQNPSPISPQNPQRGPYHNPPFNVGPVPPPKAQHVPLQSPPSDGFFYHNNTAQDPTMNGIFDSLQDTISPYPGNISWQYENPHTSPNFKEPNAVVMDMGGMASSGFTPDMKMDEEYSMTDDDDTESDTPTLEGINDHSKSTQNYLTLVSAQQAPLENYPRTFTSALPASDALTTYHPSANSSPLTDPTTAQIFYHFISVTGPSMSQFERNPVNVSWIYDSQPLPALQQHIWTCTMPTLALNNTALMHAMLALGSLHIAKLRNAPISAALKHYAIALRRVGKSVGLPGRRSQPETLAACMLLGYFEVWSADHQKWSNHLSGARQLIEEIDFADVARYVKSMKMQGRDPYAAQNSFDDPNFIGDTDGIGSEHAFGADVDENIVSALMGKQVSYLQYGSIQENIHEPSHSHKNYSRRDLEVYENQRDLFWWYCKQDVYQSLLGGGKLFMDYRRWSHCPPRAPIGRFDASYGTYDHLILLLGRLCDFASKDIKRKRRARKMNEPSEDTSMGDNETTPKARYRPRPPNARPGANDANVRPSPDAGLPMSAGVMPTLGGTPALPMGFTPSRTESPSTAENEELDMETATAKAEEEWNALLRAFLLLQDNFGPNFQSLGPEYAAPMQTPFGTALNYRSFPIACIWLNYYMGLIVLHRAHPSMPPFAIQAAMASAERTAGFANEIGRIACAISPGIATMTGVSPMIGAALIESAFCLFFAGIQYQDKQQRLWAVEHLHGIARLVGWESADAIAAGLEKTWSKAGESGNGAPWTITSGPRVVPRLDPEILVPDRRRVDLILEYNPERRLVVPKTDRAHYALGILGVEEDIEKLDLGND